MTLMLGQGSVKCYVVEGSSSGIYLLVADRSRGTIVRVRRQRILADGMDALGGTVLCSAPLN